MHLRTSFVLAYGNYEHVDKKVRFITCLFGFRQQSFPI